MFSKRRHITWAFGLISVFFVSLALFVVDRSGQESSRVEKVPGPDSQQAALPLSESINRVHRPVPSAYKDDISVGEGDRSFSADSYDDESADLTEEIVHVGKYRDPETDFGEAESQAVVHVGEFIDPDIADPVDDSEETVAVGRPINPETVWSTDSDDEIEHVGRLMQPEARSSQQSESVIHIGPLINPGISPD